jgi:hypothetical protein
MPDKVQNKESSTHNFGFRVRAASNVWCFNVSANIAVAIFKVMMATAMFVPRDSHPKAEVMH